MHGGLFLYRSSLWGSPILYCARHQGRDAHGRLRVVPADATADADPDSCAYASADAASNYADALAGPVGQTYAAAVAAADATTD
jgi:hypothetical protein